VSDIPSEVGGGAAKAAVPPASLGKAGRVLAIIAGAMIMAMMVVTTIDVIGRDVFNRPLLGAFEVTEILMGLVIFAGMPLATAAREHITVNFIETILPPRALCAQAALTDVICAVVAAVMAWRMFVRGSGLIDANEATLVLGVPRGLIAWGMAALLAATTITFLVAAFVAARAAIRGTRSA
jgi:TRAP-type C4-dicarboxylate transport system permease small subunit